MLKTCLFDAVYVIHLPRRKDRLDGFWKTMQNWPFVKPEVFEALDGLKIPAPSGYRNPMIYACTQSHLRVLEKVISSNNKSVVVFEDDCVLVSDFADKIDCILEQIPSNWECLMLGAMDQWAGHEFCPGIKVGVTKVIGTHAYALRGIRIIRDLYCQYAASPGFGDMGHNPDQAQWFGDPPFLNRYRTFVCSPPLAGQAAGTSDLTGEVVYERFT